jgi:hypothetical protein
VSCGSVRWISQIQVSLIIRTLVQWTTYVHKRFLFVKTEKCIHSMGQVGRSKHHLPASPTIPVSVHMPCSDHTESAVLLMLILYFIHKFLCYLYPSWLPNMRTWFWEVLIN